MSHREPGQPRATVGIPLFRSARFVESISRNVAAIPARDVEILISDRHCDDDALDRLAERFAEDPRVRCVKERDGLDWVGHINTLLESARGEYWRLLPHDDLAPPGSLEALMAALDSNADAVLAYGPTRAIDGEGRPLPEKDRPTPHPVEAESGWTLGLVLEMFWQGHFDGAFKGLIRRRKVMENRLLIRSTRDQIHPERCWLFALGLLGPFEFVPDAIYVKRFYEGSVHSRWTVTGQHLLSAAGTMSGYLEDLVGLEPARRYGQRDLWLNAGRLARWQDDPEGERPHYRAAPDAQSDVLRGMPLPCRERLR